MPDGGLLSELNERLANKLALSKLSEFSYIILISFAAFTFIHLNIAPAVLSWLSPGNYKQCTRSARNNWLIHVVSLAHVVVVVPLALACLRLPALNTDRVYGWDDRAGLLQAIAAGYFLWDSLDAVINFVNVGFVIHGLACFTIYTLGFKPFLAYYGVRCLLWETSTFFLNIHWFLDKTGRTGSKLQFVNGALLLVTFLTVRIIYGLYTSANFVQTLYLNRDRIPLSYFVVYMTGNFTLNALNLFWFGKMVSAMRRRLVKRTLSKAGEAGSGERTKGSIEMRAQ